MSAIRGESVWNYPRPPAVDSLHARVRVELGGVVIADTRGALRVLETSHPPGIYVPPSDIVAESLRPSPRSSFCEWKGSATYWDVESGERCEPAAAWSYPRPVSRYAVLRDFVSFYPGRMDACWIDDERVEPQPGEFYGGWITPGIEGPFKGEPGTAGW